jgi:AraC-like DNA-binding protein
MISLAAATGLMDAIAAAGGNSARVLRTVGLDRSVLAKRDEFIPSSIFARLLEAAAQETGDDCFGLHFGEQFEPKDIGALVYLVVNSPTVAVSIQNVERYFHLHNAAATVHFTIERRQGFLRYLLTGLPPDALRQQNEFSMAVVLKTFRIIAGREWKPREVHFAHRAPATIAEHLRVLGNRTLFGRATNAVVLEQNFVEHQVAAADRRLYRILKAHADRMLDKMPDGNDVLAVVNRSMVASMREGSPTLALVAKKMFMSPRTLERRLKEHKVVFRGLLDDTRRRFALDYLRDDRDTLTEIAFLLGYSEASVFNRAFKRWTGSTPSGYRHRSRHSVKRHA